MKRNYGFGVLGTMASVVALAGCSQSDSKNRFGPYISTDGFVKAEAFDRKNGNLLYVIEKSPVKGVSDMHNVTITSYIFGGGYDNNGNGRSDFSDVAEIERTQIPSDDKYTRSSKVSKFNAERKQEEKEKFDRVAKAIGWK